jgi:hypothetical protein
VTDHDPKADDCVVDAVAHWLATEYGDQIGDGPPGYWEFQARELLAVVRGDGLSA